VQARFQRWGLGHVFGTYQQFVAATQWQEHQALKFEIEAMRRRGSIQGYVITEFTDVHWECNGLLDMDRRPKAFHQILRRVNADDVIVPTVDRWDFWAGETVTVQVTASRFGAADPGAGIVRWWIDGTDAKGEIAAPSVARGQAVPVGQITFAAPAVAGDAGEQIVLRLRWEGSAGRVCAENELKLSVFPQSIKAPVPGVKLWSPDAGLAARLHALGWPLVDALAPGVMAVSRRLDTLLHNWVQDGEKVLLLADGPEAMATSLPRARIAPRAGTDWQGDWANSFSWLKRTGPFAKLPGGPLLDLSFSRVIPQHVILGISPLEFEGDVDAGLCVGWIHKPVALVALRRYGQGEALLTTFHLADEEIGVDPVATALLQALVTRLNAVSAQ
jgi:hypothetical protein